MNKNKRIQNKEVSKNKKNYVLLLLKEGKVIDVLPWRISK